jgi:hypothetical protein
VSLAAAARFEMNGIFELAGVVWEWRAVITGFVGAFVYPKTFAAKLQHLRHKGHRLKPTVAVERAKDFFFSSNFYPIAYPIFGVTLHVFFKNPDLDLPAVTSRTDSIDSIKSTVPATSSLLKLYRSK